jgi:hypothetical protein
MVFCNLLICVYEKCKCPHHFILRDVLIIAVFCPIITSYFHLSPSKANAQAILKQLTSVSYRVDTVDRVQCHGGC